MPVLNKMSKWKLKRESADSPSWARQDVDDFCDEAGLLLTLEQRLKLVNLLVDVQRRAIKNCVGDR